MNDRERFMAKVSVQQTGCWEWTGHRFPTGYGQFWMNGRDRYAHRAAYEIYVGPLLDGAMVCHHCDNRACVNPEHLYAGDVHTNARDAVSRGRLTGRRTGEPRRGALNGQAKLTDDAVRSIRADRRGGASLQSIADRFGVSFSVARRVALGLTWKHVE